MEKKNIKIKKPGKLFVISAPSGGGKTTLTKSVLRILEKDFPISMVATYTSRPPRHNEINGKDYNFISRNDFIKKMNAGFFLETTEYDNEFYGSPASILIDMKQGKSSIIVITRSGAKNILTAVSNLVLIWISIPSIKILKDRLTKRETETPKEIDARIKIAEKEIEDEKNNIIFDYHVMNDNFEKAANQICQIIKKELA